jgi:GntR family transcriptional repressor for pyruvate dehydrogenase complex
LRELGNQVTRLGVPLDNIEPARRTHVADHVFEGLARAILDGELLPGSALPPERVWVERFGVSRVLVRQAVHRLAEIGLVRVKQGGATLVLDPRDATDPRVVALLYRGGAASLPPRDAFDVLEKQYLQGLSIVEIALRRAKKDDLASLLKLVDETAKDADALAAFDEFEERFWRALAKAADNRILIREVAWWFETLAERPVPADVAKLEPAVRIQFHKELVRRLVVRDAPVEYYLAVVRPILDNASRALTPPRARHSKERSS